ncbi:sodium/proline symporter PutP [Endozoicomonas ascidiicola]|uniref:sodium/proline symporter PutP n=1 Tax=Endozoicomonas ascidiicola TaxID=1698521 RepID=UPI00082E9671|nr:sodium/proline symporter PutP [Endozoicomonas ascidiicola]
MDGQFQIAMTFLVYFAGMLGVGYLAWLRTSTGADYFLGGRSLGPWTAALSAGASDMSGWLLLGLPGYVFVAGFEAVWLGAGLLIGTWLNWLIVAKRLRVFSVTANDSLTLPEYFSNRFSDLSSLIQPISALLILVFFLFYTSSGLVAGGKLFESTFGLDYEVAVIIGMASVVSYTLFGGFLAVCWTDLIQGLLMSVAMLIVPIYALEVVGGSGQLMSELQSMDAHFTNLFTNRQGESISWITIVSLLGWGLGYFGQPHILARFKAIKQIEQLPSARRIAVSWTAVCMVGALMVGIAGLVYTQKQGIVLADPEAILMLLVNLLFHPVIAGILLAAILAAIMSTADSQLLVCSTAVAEDFYRHFFHRAASQKEMLVVGRITVVVMASIATVIALTPDSSVLAMVAYAWAGFGSAFGPALLLSLYWKRMNGLGALAGIVTGAVTVFVWRSLSGGLFDLYEMIPGFVFSSAAVVVFSLMGPKPKAKEAELFSRVQPLLDAK